MFVSASAERLFGYDISDVVGRDAFGLFDSPSLEPVRALFRDLVARRRLSVSLEMQTVRADGTTLDLDVVAVNHLSDPIGGIVVNIRDITDRKQLEQRIRDEDRRQATIIDSLADGVMMVDAAGTVVRVNEAFEVMFEAPRIRVVGRSLDALLARGAARGIELVDGQGAVLAVADHPVLASLRGGRRSVGVVLGLRRPGRSPDVDPAQHPALGRGRRPDHRRHRLVQRHHRRPPGGGRAEAGGAVPPGAVGHPGGGHRGLRRRGPHHRLQPGRPPAARPGRGRPIPSAGSRPTRVCVGPTARPWSPGRTP